jgi:hypothetical protein
MWHTNFESLLFPVLMWWAGVSVLLISYLATLAVQEKRQQRELEQSGRDFGYQLN